MSCNIKDNVLNDLKAKNIIKPTREIININEFNLINKKYSHAAKVKYNLDRTDNLFTIDVVPRTTIRARTVMRAVPNEEFFSQLENNINELENSPIKNNYKDIFKDSRVVTSKEALSTIASGNHPLKDLAKKLLEYNNDTKLYLYDKQFFEDAVGYGILKENTQGAFIVDSNRIVLNEGVEFRNNRIEPIVLHEILHALTYKEIKNNPEVRADLELLLNKAKSELKGGHYALTNVDEFVVALFTDSAFINELKNIPAVEGKVYNNLFEELFDKLMKLFNIQKKDTLYKQAFSLATNIIDGSNVSNVSNTSSEINQILDKPKINPIFVSNQKLVDYSDPLIIKQEQDKLKEEFEDLQNLINCIWS